MGLWQFRVAAKAGHADPTGRATLQLLQDFGIASVCSVRYSKIFTIDLSDSCERDTVSRIASDLLTDPVTEQCDILHPDVISLLEADAVAIEVHFRPGVMDNVANSAMLALREMGIKTHSVRTARRFVLSPSPSAEELRRIPRLLGNDCVEEVVIGGKPLAPAREPPRYEFKIRYVSICGLDAAALEQLSRQAHLFLSLSEMRAVQAHFQARGREPTDLEIETIAQTWSEHCVHKTLTSAIEYHGEPFPHAAHRTDGNQPFSRRYDNLLRDTIARATEELARQGRGPLCLSVFKDNAGIIAFDEDHGIAFKVETHNHPSAIEPYGGSATGIGGVIRDVLGCGLGAKPVANTDVFCVAPPDWPIDAVPKGVIHPRQILKGIVAGVRDYGNRMGIPTVNGAVHFDPRYLGNPLVYCGCVGLIPRNRIEKKAVAGDAIVVIGGRTGRDGIHGATFSSAELTDTHVDEFSHAVQIGNAIEEKKILDVVVQARDYPTTGAQRRCLYSAITDCGAGGLSSAIGEMGAETGVEVDLELAPLKYAGLRYDEIWISEAQERMVVAVPPENVDTFLALTAAEDVEATVIGRFTNTRRLIVRYNGVIVGDLPMELLHHGVPKAKKRAEWHPRQRPVRPPSSSPALTEELCRRLADPNTASKHWIIRQYDHEVQGGSVVKPLVGPGDGPSDAAVLRPRLDSNRGIALACGLAPALGDEDPYWMAVAAIDEALRNVVCVGGDPGQTAILDNFCWPRADQERRLGALVRTCQACHDAALAYGVPFISGKDSLNNEFAMNDADAEMVRELVKRRWPEVGPAPGTDHRLAIPYTLLISALSIIKDVRRCISAAPRPTRGPARLYLCRLTARTWPEFSLARAATLHQAVAAKIQSRDIAAAHDCGDGGPAVAVAEMAISAGVAARFHLSATESLDSPFAAVPCAYILQAADGAADGPPPALMELARLPGVVVAPAAELDTATGGPEFRFISRTGDVAATVPLDALRAAWRGTLDW